MSEELLIIYVFLFVFTTCILFLYYRRIREGVREYTKAKTVLDDIILSFNRDLQRQEEKIQEISNKSEKASVENSRAIEEINSRIADIKVQLENLVKTKESFINNYDLIKKKIDELASQRDEILEKISELESLGMKMIPEDKGKSAIPIRREKALAPLTETELKILELLAVEGEKTVPQIKDIIKLTREHTARLMKKLYASGYVERRTEKMPYLYRIKEEMKNILKKQDTKI